jgi:hypothetical protein
VPNDELEKFVPKRPPTVAHKSYSNAVIRLRRKRTTRIAVKKTRSFVVDSTQNNLPKSKSENIINVDVKPKKIFVEKNIGDSVEIGQRAEENPMMGTDLLRAFAKRKSHVNEMGDGRDPRSFFGEPSGIIAPLNSDAESDC